MSAGKEKKTSVLNLSVFNFVKNYICETNNMQTESSVSAADDLLANEINSKDLSDDGKMLTNKASSVKQQQQQQYRSSMQSNDENESMENTPSMQIDDELPM